MISDSSLIALRHLVRICQTPSQEEVCRTCIDWRLAIPGKVTTPTAHSPFEQVECIVSDIVTTVTESALLKDAVDHVMYIPA